MLTKLTEVIFPSETDDDVNIARKRILDNVSANIRLWLPQVRPYSSNTDVALLVCGGPSLNATLAELRDAHWRGGKIVTVNGSYNWCIDNGLRPSATVMLDGRAFNARFVARDVPKCRYLLASQCDPNAFDICAGRDVTIWHTCSGGDEELALLRDYYFDRISPVTIGTTVAIRAISLLRMLGFLRIEIFGLDSCWLDGEHHAYPQVENDTDQRIEVTLRPTAGDNRHRDSMARHFICAPWHMRQAQCFLKLTQERGDMLQLRVHGPGMIASMIELGATLDEYLGKE